MKWAFGWRAVAAPSQLLQGSGGRKSQNWHPDELAARGRVTPDLARARVLLIGAGALGSVVAEYLIRAGVTSMAVVDSETVAIGNLVRHTATIEQLGEPKAEALAARLNAASPNSTVTAHRSTAEELLAPDFVGDFDLVIETTGDHFLLELLGGVDAPSPITYASLSVSLHARHLIAYLSHGRRFPVDEFESAYSPFARSEFERGEERPWEGVGCWHPVFPARVDQLALMASAAVGLLNNSWPIADGSAILHMFERTVDAQGCFNGIRVACV